MPDGGRLVGVMWGAGGRGGDTGGKWVGVWMEGGTKPAGGEGRGGAEG